MKLTANVITVVIEDLNQTVQGQPWKKSSHHRINETMIWDDNIT
jgi:hypothetical protein